MIGTDASPLLCGEHGQPLVIGGAWGIRCTAYGPQRHPLTDPEPCDLTWGDLDPEWGERIDTVNGALFLTFVGGE